jgi:DNA repair exonuclease SbcCD ATPase subunit
MWRLFKSRSRAADPRDSLLEALLKIESARLASASELQQRRDELELQKLKLEIENAETLAKVKAEQERAREELREIRRANLAKAREKWRQQQAERRAAPATSCRVCTNPSDPSLTVEEITYHHAGHPASGATRSLFA